MAHTLSARKRVRQNARRSDHNKPVRTRAANTLRDARVAIRDNADNAADLVRQAQAALDTAARHRIIHPNAAARRKSRLAQQLKAVATA
jgi:small subunit ribosomal protein S20